MLRAGQDDGEAFSRLVHRYRPQVVAALVRLVGRRDIAEELAQEVFLRAFVARKRYTPRAKFSTWLFTIVRNLGLNERRKLSLRGEVNVHRWPDSSSPVRTPAPSLLTDETPESLFEARERQILLRRAIGDLNERQRRAIVLYAFKSLDHDQVALQMGTTPQAVKSLLARARRNLRELLQSHVESV